MIRAILLFVVISNISCIMASELSTKLMQLEYQLKELSKMLSKTPKKIVKKKPDNRAFNRAIDPLVTEWNATKGELPILLAQLKSFLGQDWSKVRARPQLFPTALLQTLLGAYEEIDIEEFIKKFENAMRPFNMKRDLSGNDKQKLRNFLTEVQNINNTTFADMEAAVKRDNLFSNTDLFYVFVDIKVGPNQESLWFIIVDDISKEVTKARAQINQVVKKYSAKLE